MEVVAQSAEVIFHFDELPYCLGRRRDGGLVNVF